MNIPRFWARAGDEEQTREGKRLALAAWGWSDSSPSEARTKAAERLARLLARVRRGDPLPRFYACGSRPLREQIVHEVRHRGAVMALVTRNRYGSLVLNTARLLFIDVDVAAESGAP